MKRKKILSVILALLFILVLAMPVFASDDTVPLEKFERIIDRTFDDLYDILVVVPCIDTAQVVHPYHTAEELAENSRYYAASLRKGIGYEGVAYFWKSGNGNWVLKDYDLEAGGFAMLWQSSYYYVAVYPPEEKASICTLGNCHL